MRHKTNKQKCFVLLLFLSVSLKLFSQEISGKDTSVTKIKSKFEVGAEYLVPTRFSDQIKTVNLHAFFWKQYFKDITLMVNVGLTSTYAWGYTSQYDLIMDTIHITNYKTNAFGLGPSLQIDFSPVKIKRFSLVVEASGAFILYSNHFPYGGDIYNFMFRTGPSITYQLKSAMALKAGYRWMHVSNGQGYGKQNPFYEAQGIHVGIVIVK